MTQSMLNARHWIGGEWVDSKVRSDSFNPATGEKIGSYAQGGATEALQAIKVARKAFVESNWSGDRRLRAKAINDMADLFESRLEALVDILALENGKVVAYARFEVKMVPRIPDIRSRSRPGAGCVQRRIDSNHSH